MSLYYIILSFFVYGFFGWCVEVIYAAVKQRKFVNRGFLNGPICPIYGVGIIIVVEILEPFMEHTVFLYFGAVILATALEWLTGFLLEKLFHHKWWDYSNMPLNLNGYVCVLFSLIWGAACVVVVRIIHPFVYSVLAWLPRWAGILALVVCIFVFIPDIYVTVTGILKLNRRLKAMEEIASELHKVSDKIGENISRNVIVGLEWQEDAKLRREELKLKYRELIETQSLTSRRIMKAFPKMKPTSYENQFKEVKEYFMKVKQEKKRKALKDSVD